MNESFVFYRSFIDAMDDLPPEQYKTLMQAVSRYALDGIVPDEMDPMLKGYFLLMKPQIDANEKRRESGRKGGSKPKQTEASGKQIEANSKQTEANDKQTEANANANVNANVNANAKEKKAAPKHKHGRYGHVLLTDTEYLTLKTAYGEQQAEAAIEYLDEYTEMKGYKAKSHYLAIRKWVFNAMKEDEIRKNRNGPVKQEESDDEFYARLEREYSGI